MKTARLGSYQGGKGYLMTDNRVSGGGLEEYNTLTCSHCSTVVVLNSQRLRPRSRCVRCSRYICDRCGVLYEATGECNRTEEMVDLALKYPGQGPFLARGPQGQPLYDTRLRDNRRLWEHRLPPLQWWPTKEDR